MNEPLGDREVLSSASSRSTATPARATGRASSPPRRPTAEPLYERFLRRARRPAGVFGAHMEVELVNDGPVTLMVEV